MSTGAVRPQLDEVALIAELRRTRGRGEPALLAAWRVWNGVDIDARLGADAFYETGLLAYAAIIRKAGDNPLLPDIVEATRAYGGGVLIFRALVAAEAASDRAMAFVRTSPALRWPRTAWRHGYALTAGVGGLGVFVFGLVLLVGRSGPASGSYVTDVAVMALLGAMGAGLVYGSLGGIAWLYRVGILRGGRRTN